MVQALADAAVNSAQAHRVTPPGERRTAELIRELADQPAAGKALLKALEDEIEQLVTAHPDGPLIRRPAGNGGWPPGRRRLGLNRPFGWDVPLSPGNAWDGIFVRRPGNAERHRVSLSRS